MPKPNLSVPVLVVVVGLLTGGAVLAGDDDYQVSMVLPNANNLFEGASVMRNGFPAGTVSDIEVVDGKAKLRLDLDGSFGELHEGAKVEVVWKGVLGERLVNLTDGPTKNAAIPDGALLTDVMSEPVELTEVLAALDEPTRAKLNTLVAHLDAVLQDREKPINEALQAAGPAVQALGQLLGDLGTDGEAIKQLVTQSNNTMEILAERDATVARIVTSLSSLSATIVQRRTELGESLEALPDVLAHGQATLDAVPGAVDQTVPLLEDLAPATDKLDSVSGNLLPVLRDLRPAVADLRPTLGSLAELLGFTPALMDSGVATLPEADQAVEGATAAVDFLRPYTPELVGWMANWGSAGGNYDANGHYARFHIFAGAESPVGLVNAPGPGVTQNLTPEPGDPVGQPWTDAYGDGLQ